MKIKINNKKVLILMLIVLLLILAVGYAIFSETLTISGTANAKGTFDLEFQNAEIVKNIGADKEKTTAVISTDKDTLTVNAADLAYPGAGVEFSVDIVNVGTMPAEVQAVTPNNITGSDKIKVTGLDGIKVGHPKIEVRDRCNIHFTVEWPIDVGEIPESESTISFGLQIEYTQATGEVFNGQTSHTDTDKEGNTITNSVTGGEIEEPEDNRLVAKITAEDYGKSINYKATVKNNNTNENEEVTNWKVLYNDKSNVYLILDDYLPNNLVPIDAGLDTEGEYQVYSSTSRAVFLDGLKTESYWTEFANGVEGAIATGAPTYEMLTKSHNEKYGTNLTTNPYASMLGSILDKEDTLYVPHRSEYNGCAGYWSSSIRTESTLASIYAVKGNSLQGAYLHSNSSFSVRPVVKLPTTVEGTVGETVELK